MTESIDLVAWAALVIALVAMILAVLTSRAHARISKIERRLARLPEASEITNLRVKIAAMESKQDAMLTETHATRASVRRIEDFLLKRKTAYHDSQF